MTDTAPVQLELFSTDGETASPVKKVRGKRAKRSPSAKKNPAPVSLPELDFGEKELKALPNAVPVSLKRSSSLNTVPLGVFSEKAPTLPDTPVTGDGHKLLVRPAPTGIVVSQKSAEGSVNAAPRKKQSDLAVRETRQPVAPQNSHSEPKIVTACNETKNEAPFVADAAFQADFAQLNPSAIRAAKIQVQSLQRQGRSAKQIAEALKIPPELTLYWLHLIEIDRMDEFIEWGRLIPEYSQEMEDAAAQLLARGATAKQVELLLGIPKNIVEQWKTSTPAIELS